MLNKFQESTPHAMAQEMGNRLRQVRLNKNLTQAEIAERAGLDRRRVIKAENGNASLEDFFAILDVLEKTDQLVNFLPEQRISPVQLLIFGMLSTTFGVEQFKGGTKNIF